MKFYESSFYENHRRILRLFHQSERTLPSNMYNVELVTQNNTIDKSILL